MSMPAAIIVGFATILTVTALGGLALAMRHLRRMPPKNAWLIDPEA